MGEKSQFWRRWLSNLLMLSSVALPICLKAIYFDRVHAELHHFADASQTAYGTVSYTKLVNGNSRTHCSFFAGKSRVAHVKQMTIPRLELSAALLAVNESDVTRGISDKS